ncbi:MAG: DsrE family protein [Methanocellales archaeon]
MTEKGKGKEGNRKKILYVQTSGVDTPERLYSPFVLAMTAKAMDLDAVIYFLGKGITVVKKGEAEKIKLGNFPSLREIMDQAIKAGVELMVCEQSTQLIALQRGDFIPEAKIVGAATLNDLALEVDASMWF